MISTGNIKLPPWAGHIFGILMALFVYYMSDKDFVQGISHNWYVVLHPLLSFVVGYGGTAQVSVPAVPTEASK